MRRAIVAVLRVTELPLAGGNLRVNAKPVALPAWLAGADLR